MHDISRLSLKEMTELSSQLRVLGTRGSCMEDAAEGIVRHLYEHLLMPDTAERACALVRFYKTQPMKDLPEYLREPAQRSSPEPVTPYTICLTLIATVGDEPGWNDRRKSVNHQAIPLPSRKVLSQLPMIAQLVKQLGIEVAAVLKPDPLLIVDLEQRTFNVFYVAKALGSPFIPAQQQFVVPYRIESVLGFGGILPAGDLFAVILFSRTPIPPQTAELFRPLALSTKLAILPFVGRRVFRDAS